MSANVDLQNSLHYSAKMVSMPRKRVFAGRQVRAMREKLGMGQLVLAKTLDISVSYLSQIESGDRPLTPKVLASLARSYPVDWSDVDFPDATTLRAAVAAAVADPTVLGESLDERTVQRAVRQQPQFARRMVDLHSAYQRAQEQLASLNDSVDTGSSAGTPMPWEAVRDWFHDVGNHVDVIDRAAESIALERDCIGPAMAEAIVGRLRHKHGITVVTSSEDSSALKQFDPVSQTLTLNRSLASASRAFLLAEQLGRIEFGDLISTIAKGSSLPGGEATALLAAGLANYFAGALLMPYSHFRRRAHEVRHDIDRLAATFGVSFEQACHRLSTLQRPGAQGIPFFFCRVDLAGNITKRHSATRLKFARFGGACPLWSVHEAVAIPDRIMVQLVEMPDGSRYASMARGMVKPSGSFQELSRRYAVVLGCEVEHAKLFVYADNIGDQPTPIGVSCRICPREDCSQRAFPAAGRPLSIDPNTRGVVPYSMQ